MAKVAFNTLGCKVNQYETESMMAQFEAKGYQTVAFSEKADVYIVNTCTVTNMADKKSRQMLSKAKKANRQALVVAVGCYVQASPDSLDKVEHVDLLVGNPDKGRIVDVVEEYLGDHIIPEVTDLTRYRQYDDMWPTHTNGHTRAHIKIQDGCDQFCSYCIIPYARGRIRSRDPESILEEVKGLTSRGYKEVVLTGIHLASYGVQFENYELIDLLEDLDRIDGLERIRLGSLEPTLVDSDFAARLEGLEHLCGHFHLSMQSGDDEILSAMNRKYDTEDYFNAVLLLRDIFPSCAITTDLIVGFPGETEAQFGKTMDFLCKVGFSDVHVFKYSLRDGTKAAAMANQVDGNVKNQRSQRAMTMANTLRKTYGDGFKNRTLQVLVEESVVIEDTCYYVGHTDNYLKVYIASDGEELLNTLVDVCLSVVFSDGYLGNLIN